MFPISEKIDNIISLMKNFKLILASLVSNDTSIDGARKKPWYFAVLILLASILISIIPGTVAQIKVQGDDMFSGNTFGAYEATYEFAQELNKDYTGSMVVRYNEETKQNELENGKFTRYNHKNATSGVVDYVFAYQPELDTKEANLLSPVENPCSYIVFSKTKVLFHIINPVDKTNVNQIDPTYNDAYKEFKDGYSLVDLLGSGANNDEIINNTWQNWLSFCRDSFSKNRTDGIWIKIATLSGLGIFITALMGLMVWILTRGKNNPYRLFTFWEGQKIAYWSALSPALLTCLLGFLIDVFAQMGLVLLLGLRVMWLTMKSLRPDGTGYAAN